MSHHPLALLAGACDKRGQCKPGTDLPSQATPVEQCHTHCYLGGNQTDRLAIRAARRLTHSQTSIICGGCLQKECVHSIRQQPSCCSGQHHNRPGGSIIQGVVVGAAGHKLAELPPAGLGFCVASGVQQQAARKLIAREPCSTQHCMSLI